MMEVVCRSCERKINSENINVAKDTAYCSACENIMVLSEVVSTPSNTNSTPGSSEAGVKIIDQSYNWSIEARHLGLLALFSFIVTASWTGTLLSVINFMKTAKVEFDLGLSLFGMPFLIVNIFMVAFTLMNIFGRTVISNKDGEALIFVGIGKIGWYRRFEWRSIERVSVIVRENSEYISLEGSSLLNFGGSLSHKKLHFITNFLRSKLKK